MTARRTVAAAALCLALSGGACAQDKVVTNKTTGTSIGVEHDARPGVDGQSLGAAGRTPGAGSYSAASPPPAGFRDPDFAARGAVPLTAKIEPGCVEHGETLVITARSRKGAYIRMTVLFPNGEARGVPSRAATAGSNGTTSWSLGVTDAAGTGDGVVQMSARDPDSDEQGTSGSWDFVVAARGGCQR